MRSSGNQKVVEKDKSAIFLIPLIVILTGLVMTVIILLFTRYMIDETNDSVSSAQEMAVSIDDDPYSGNKNAKFAIVEFSDYECPYCKDYYTNTYSQIKKDYVDSGKLLYVFRDSPLQIHDPLATKQAMAAECVHELGGNEKYFEYHNLLFENTTSNGNGMLESKISELAGTLNIDNNKFKECYQDQKYNAEIQKDINAASKVGVTGTPGFVIGRLDKDGNVKGAVVKGAQSYEFMKMVIESQLQK